MGWKGRDCLKGEIDRAWKVRGRKVYRNSFEIVEQDNDRGRDEFMKVGKTRKKG